MIVYEGIPSKFVQVHACEISSWLSKVLADMHPPVLQVVPAEPIGEFSLEGPCYEIGHVVTLRMKERPRQEGERVYEISVGAFDSEILQAWADRHKDTTLADFLWSPFVAFKSADQC